MGAQESSHTQSSTRNNRSKSEPSQKYQRSFQTLFQSPNLQQLETHFAQTPSLAKGLFTLFSNVDHSYRSYIQVMAFLTKLDVEAHLNPWLVEVSRQTSVLDRFFMVIYGVQKTKEYQHIMVQRQQKERCIMQFFSLFCQPKPKHLEKVTDAIANFDVPERLVEFVEKLKNTLHYGQKLLIEYWTNKFTTLNKRHLIHKKTPSSNLLSREDWVVLGMENIKILRNQPTLLYSVQKNGSSFSSLYRHLIGYNGPWMIVLSHYETDILTGQLNLCIFGSFQQTPAEDVVSYQGSPDSFLFRLSPNLKYFKTEQGEGGSNFFVINTTQTEISKNPRGLGFGGQQKENCKFWIDERIEKDSYVTNKDDQTYGFGYIAFPGTSTLKVRDLQIWGLGDQQSLKSWQQYWISRQQEASKRRKIDKKQMLSGGLVNLLFQNTFKHREQIVGEVPTMKGE